MTEENRPQIDAGVRPDLPNNRTSSRLSDGLAALTVFDEQASTPLAEQAFSRDRLHRSSCRGVAVILPAV